MDAGLGKLLIGLGVLFVVAGFILIFKLPIPYLGKLPGDITLGGDNYTLYIPITTSILISIIISIILYIFSSK